MGRSLSRHGHGPSALVVMFVAYEGLRDRTLHDPQERPSISPPPDSAGPAPGTRKTPEAVRGAPRAVSVGSGQTKSG